MANRIDIYDVTLRDGAQGPGIKFSAEDQLRVVRALDDFGVKYIEGGQPGSNPKAAELFERTRDMELKNAVMTAFGSTRYPKSTVEDDANLRALLSAETEVITIFAKSSPTHATEVLRVSLDENIILIEESVHYLKSQNRRVFLDAEHFFDGFAEDSEYALTVLEAGWRAGAEIAILCDTNGGRLPSEIVTALRAAQARLPEMPLGIHTHNDVGCGVANTLAAVDAGVVQVQGCINGYGERTGNANLCTIVPALQLKMGYDLVTPDQLRGLSAMSHLVAELANMVPDDSAPFVGRNAFTHKGGMHADAVRKMKSSYEHIDPLEVGNTTHIPVSEVAGRSSLLEKAAELGIVLDKEDPSTREIMQEIKDLENEGFEFEGADASLELLIRRHIGDYTPFFTLEGFHASVVRRGPDRPTQSEATVKLSLPDGTRMHTASEGDGPVDALDRALRKALEGTYPELGTLYLEDYKVRILDSRAATRARTRVLIESSDGQESWNTVGVSENVITASYLALVDSIEYLILKTRTEAAASKIRSDETSQETEAVDV
ncbi:MAG: citramalate synthase [Candidatus Hydrogenedentes bacterium]|nr:citramalate synthase [Candidatus Hydrogenedentota bacterium]